MSDEPETPFEKTFRLVTRLDDAEIDYVRDTSEWITRCVLRVRELDPLADMDALTAEVLAMSTRGRWRLMKPEIVGDQLVLPVVAPVTSGMPSTPASSASPATASPVATA